MLAVVNNGTQFLADLLEALDQLVLEHEVLVGDRRLTATAMKRYSGAILTGGHLHVYDPDHHRMVALDEQFLSMGEVPVLGICLGHQLIARHYGAEVEPLPGPIDRHETIELVARRDPLLDGLPRRIRARLAHGDAVTTLPKPLVRLASSRAGENEAIRHDDRPVYGLQFHPELSSQEGLTILKNFAQLCGESTLRNPTELPTTR